MTKTQNFARGWWDEGGLDGGGVGCPGCDGSWVGCVGGCAIGTRGVRGWLSGVLVWGMGV